jgi:hypothetical protein
MVVFLVFLLWPAIFSYGHWQLRIRFPMFRTARYEPLCLDVIYHTESTLKEFLPGKRAFTIGLVIYHSVCSTVLLQAPRFIPHSFGEVFERWVMPLQ